MGGKVLDYEAKIIRNEGISIGIVMGKQEGIEIGKEKGIAIGKEKGIAIGKEKGIAIGKEEGIEIGKEEGIEIGTEEGIRQGVIHTASILQDLGCSDIDIMDKITERYKMSNKQVRKILLEAGILK